MKRAIDRVEILLATGTNVLFQPPAQIASNSVVAITQIANQNELNGILLGLGVETLRCPRLPISKAERKVILSMMKRLKTL